jgi:threonine dehydrogenase-like Zn-dependent dehydrogenase
MIKYATDAIVRITTSTICGTDLHRFALADVMTAYDTFGDAVNQRALKVVLKNA